MRPASAAFADERLMNALPTEDCRRAGDAGFAGDGRFFDMVPSRAARKGAAAPVQTAATPSAEHDEMPYLCASSAAARSMSRTNSALRPSGSSPRTARASARVDAQVASPLNADL